MKRRAREEAKEEKMDKKKRKENKKEKGIRVWETLGRGERAGVVSFDVKAREGEQS